MSSILIISFIFCSLIRVKRLNLEFIHLQNLKFMFSTIKRVHFIGIGGIGMSGIAEILINQGFEVSGSDILESENTEYLRKIGAKIFIGHKSENINDAEVVVYSSAVKLQDNPETKEAITRNIPIIRRAEMLAEVSRLNYCVAIAGTHGKTTTTSMCGLILIKAGIDPTVLVGGRLRDFGGTNARLGKGEWTVVEADEFDRSFLQLQPTIAVINNIEKEHLDIYEDIEDLKNTFLEFANKTPFYGFVAIGLDDFNNKEILDKINKKVVTFGLSRHSDIRADEIVSIGKTTKFRVSKHGEVLGHININSPGEHNIKNALAAITVALQLGVSFEIIQESLNEFNGVYRRFDIKGNYQGAMVVDDYAHHPSEIQATLSAARNGWNKKIIAVFQPHTFTRTRDLWQEFGKSFDEADIAIITDVYPSRELPIEGINGKLIADAAIKYGHKNIVYIPNIDNVQEELSKIIKGDEIIITLGAGSIWKLAESLTN